ncbi:MAG: CopD family protein [Rhodospirillaceae bacterium]
MALLFDIFGFLTVLMDGAAMVALAFTLGGVFFLLLLARPLAGDLGDIGEVMLGRTRTILVWSAFALAVVVGGRAFLEAYVLAGTLEVPLTDALGALFVRAGLVIAVSALATAVLVATRLDQHRPLLLPLVVCMILGATALLTHGAARIEDRALLLSLIVVHLVAVGVWLGGLPYFLSALALTRDHVASHKVGSRFSLMALVSVSVLLASGIGMSYSYIDSAAAVYGTAYGAMLFTKLLMFAGLLGFGFKNMLIVHRLRRSPDAPVLVMRRFAEVELGVGIAVILSAASLTSLPPASDLMQDRVEWHDLLERLTPGMPRLVSPDHDQLAIPALEAKLQAARAAGDTGAGALAYVPGAGTIVPPNAVDIAWSEFNHNCAGIAVVLIGLLALLDRTGWVPIARHWPLLFLALAGFVVVRADPEAWPLGHLGFWESLRDPEVAQHRVFAAITIGFGLFEWAVRIGALRSKAAALVFPLMVAIGGTVMLTHSHALGNIRQELLIEWTHIPVAVFGIAAGWARWLELRLPPPRGRFYGLLWPVLFIVIGLALMVYREA